MLMRKEVMMKMTMGITAPHSSSGLYVEGGIGEGWHPTINMRPFKHGPVEIRPQIVVILLLQ